MLCRAHCPAYTCRFAFAWWMCPVISELLYCFCRNPCYIRHNFWCIVLYHVPPLVIAVCPFCYEIRIVPVVIHDLICNTPYKRNICPRSEPHVLIRKSCGLRKSRVRNDELCTPLLRFQDVLHRDRMRLSGIFTAEEDQA